MSDPPEGFTVTIRELRTDWPYIKERVARGERLILTDNGTPIMQLVPLEGPPLDLATHWQQRLEDARRIRQGKSTGASTVLEERAASRA
jgi:antitoxin (DNA-binding transcriptional repressor) of toxin-antitoxin stability system